MTGAKLAVYFSLALFVGMAVCLEAGYRLGRRGTEQQPSAHEGIGAIEAAIFALLGLLLGFSFSGGMSRLEARRQMIVQEANAIGTAYLRIDELPSGNQPEMRQLFRDYTDARLRAYAGLPDMERFRRGLVHCAELQKVIWARAVEGSRADPTHNAARLFLPALNEMIDITTARTIGIETHLPPLIFYLLIVVATLSALLAGYSMAKRRSRSLLHMLIYAAAISVTVYAVVDLDYPRSGLIRVDAADKALVDLRNSIR
jgi:hypothetical protein